MDDLGAFEVGDHTTSNTNNVSRCSAKVVVPCSRSSPYFVVLQQIRINEHTQLCAVTKGRHATIGLGNLSIISASTDLGMVRNVVRNSPPHLTSSM